MRIAVDGRNLAVRPTGIQRYLVETCEALAARGHEIRLFLPSRPFDESVIGRFPGADVANFPGGPGRLAWQTLSLPGRVAAAAPDIFWGPAHRLPWRLPATLPRIVTIHDLVWRKAPSSMRLRGLIAEAAFMGRAIAVADMVCCVSAATAADVAEAYPAARDKVAVVSQPVSSLAGVDPVGSLESLGVAKPYVLFVGTIEPRKNLEGLVEGFARLPPYVQARTQLVICGGPGWGGVDTRALAAKAGLADRVRLVGHVSDAELAALYRDANCLALVSFLEGFGIPIVEAQRHGVPAVVSNLSAMPGTAGEGALTVDPRDPAAIGAALGRLLGDAELHARLSAAARRNAQRFSPEATGAAMEAAIERAVERRGAGGAVRS